MNFQAALPVPGDPSLLPALRQRDYFVDGALGNDLGSGNNLEPFRTIMRAITAADEFNNPGENNIFIQPGYYQEFLEINDDDLLHIQGLGQNRWDVTIETRHLSNQMPYSLNVTGGSEVSLSNMHVTGRQNGIGATQLDSLLLDKMFVANNSQNGLQAFDIGDVRITNSWFTGNVGDGAEINESQHIDISDSLFQSNQYVGLRVSTSASLNITRTNAVLNGVGGTNSGRHGVSVLRVDTTRIEQGHFSRNVDSGIVVSESKSLEMHQVNASGNGQNGAASFGQFVTIHGGNFSNNFDIGVAISGPRSSGAGLPAMPSHAKIYGGNFDRNQYGFTAGHFGSLEGYSVNASNNRTDGMWISDIGDGRFYDTSLNYNGEHGATLINFDRGRLVRFSAAQNRERGLNILGGRHWTVAGGYIHGNGNVGVLAEGFASVGSRLDLKNVMATGNMEGLIANHVDLVKIRTSTFSENRGNGMQFFNVSQGIVNHSAASNNGQSGLRFNVGRTYQSSSENKSRVEINGGIYQRNYGDGVFLSDKYNTTGIPNHLVLVANYVTSVDNGGDGMDVVSDKSDALPALLPVPETGHGSMDLQLTGGLYARNHGNGIGFQYSDEESVQADRVIKAGIHHVFAQENKGHGLAGRGSVRSNGTGVPAVDVQWGYFGLNQRDGLNLGLQGIAPDDVAEAFSPTSVANPFGARLYHVVAMNNGGHGLRLLVVPGNSWGSDWTPVDLLGGSYSVNGGDGLNVYAGTGSNPFSSHLYFSHVSANHNHGNGINLTGYRDSAGTIGARAYFTGGNFNANGVDGINARQFSRLALNRTNGIANGDNGLDVKGIASLDFATAVFVSNGSYNITIS